MANKSKETKSFYLAKDVISGIEKLAKTYGINASAALQVIYYEWARTAEGTATTGGNGANHEQD